MVLRQLPLDELVCDPDNPRIPRREDEAEDQWLQASIAELGLLTCLHVVPLKPGGYLIVDGNRRYRCLKNLGYRTAECRIHQPMSPGERAFLRWRLHELVKPLTVPEQLGEARRLKGLGYWPRRGANGKTAAGSGRRRAPACWPSTKAVGGTTGTRKSATARQERSATRGERGP